MNHIIHQDDTCVDEDINDENFESPKNYLLDYKANEYDTKNPPYIETYNVLIYLINTFLNSNNHADWFINKKTKIEYSENTVLIS